MKKNELIESLNGIEGNPEIIIYNESFKDYMYLNVIKSDKLYKFNDEQYLKLINLERDEENEELLRELPENYKFKPRDWEIGKQVDFSDDDSWMRCYHHLEKPVIILTPIDRKEI